LITKTCPIECGPVATVVVVVAPFDIDAGAGDVELVVGVDCFEDDEHAPNTSAQLTIATRVLISGA
jgi:hypothetical protein